MTTVLFRAKKGHKRRYEVSFNRQPGYRYTRPDGWEREVTTRLSRRVLAVVLFQKWFGREPDFSFAIKGYAKATNRRGEVVEVTQVNNFSQFPDNRGLLLAQKCEAA